MYQTIRVRGEEQDILAIKKELEPMLASHTVTISEPMPYIAKLSSRQAFRQNELFEILIAVAINLATSLVYDELKSILAKHREKGKVDVHYEHDTTKEEKDAPSQPTLDEKKGEQ